jgi:predicted RNA binding protein YcfA (HicA-like mRNA interferase family)
MNKDIWEQIKNIDKKTLISALERDGWVYDTEHNKYRTYRKGTDKITIHYHNTTFRNPKLLKRILADIGWQDDDYSRLKLFK